MKSILLTLLLLFAFATAQARVRYVDKNGSAGSYTTIQAAIDACIDGDTVRILPDNYHEQISIGKNIVVQGGGATSTTLSVSTITTGAVVQMTAGKLMWLTISSSLDGLYIQNATVANCIFSNIAGTGVYCNAANAVLANCVFSSCGNAGCIVDLSGSLTALNCIAINCGKGFYRAGCGGTYITRYCDAYGNGCDYCNGNGIGCGNYPPTETQCLSVDPGFSSNWSTGGSSGVKHAGDPTTLNLDGSRSDMGYYGGQDAPLLPYVTSPQNIKLNADGTIHFDMLGKVGY